MGAQDLQLKSALSEWCSSYVGAFSDFDPDRIGEHWAFPALIVHDGKRAVFKTAEHFFANTSALLSFYKRQGVARADRELLSCMMMTDDAASMRVKDVMRDCENNEIVSWTAAYVLQCINGDWKAVFAVADGEAAAWSARGTPIGS